VRSILDEGSDLGDDDSASGSAGEEPSERDRDVMR